MDIQDLEIFARVAALQNLSAVGTELGLTPGTISKRIQAMEEELSVRLFERTTRSIRITDEGSRFLTHATVILCELDIARASMADTSGKPKGKLRIAAPHVLARDVMAPAILAFIDAYAEIGVHIDFTDLAVNPQEGGYDVVIHAGTLSDSALIAKQLCKDELIVVAAPAYLAASGRPMHPADLTRHEALAHGDIWTWTFRRDGEEQNVRIQARLRSDSHEMLRLAAVAGHGLLRTSRMQVERELAVGSLEQVLDDYVIGGNAGVYALYLSGRHLLPRLRVFLDFIGAWFQERARAPAEPLRVVPRPAVNGKASAVAELSGTARRR